MPVFRQCCCGTIISLTRPCTSYAISIPHCMPSLEERNEEEGSRRVFLSSGNFQPQIKELVVSGIDRCREQICPETEDTMAIIFDALYRLVRSKSCDVEEVRRLSRRLNVMLSYSDAVRKSFGLHPSSFTYLYHLPYSSPSSFSSVLLFLASGTRSGPPHQTTRRLCCGGHPFGHSG
jgi:hypothetical protein